MYFFCYSCYSCSPRTSGHANCSECGSRFLLHLFDDDEPEFDLIIPDLRPILHAVNCLPQKLQHGHYRRETQSEHTSNYFDHYRVAVIQQWRAEDQDCLPERTSPYIRVPKIWRPITPFNAITTQHLFPFPPLLKRPFDATRDESICAICLESQETSNVVQTDCNHSFHFDCLKTWFKCKNSCPLCNHIIPN